MEIDTRGSLMCLIDYEQIYEAKKSMEDAAGLIKGLPSLSILLHVATINRVLYLHDSGIAGQQTQNDILKGMLRPKSDFLKRIIEVSAGWANQGVFVAFFHRYSNLLFYELILEHYNDAPIRDLTPVECERLVMVYFMLNGIANERINIRDGVIDKAFDEEKIEEVLLTHFIYQKDYTSNIDYSNQVTRGYYFFKYLEEHPIFSHHISAYYTQIGIQHRSELLLKFISAFTQILNNNGKSIITLVGDISALHNQFLVQMAIDPTSFKVNHDDSFSQLRNQMFLRLPNNKLMLLDINFFIDQLYKTHVFGFNALMKTHGEEGFLAKKGEEFTEKIYLPMIMQRCFPQATCLPGSALPNSKKNDLTDYVVQQDGRVLFIELKDILLPAGAKNAGDKDILFDALDEKLLENKKRKPKGIQQLAAGISELIAHADRFSSILTGTSDTIYPVLIYTDNALGYEGMNKKYRAPFRELLEEVSVIDYTVRDVVFINLSFFEHYEDLLKTGQLDIFLLIDDYLQHVTHPNTAIVPFEVFAAAYRKGNINQQWEQTSFYKETADQVKKELFLSE